MKLNLNLQYFGGRGGGSGLNADKEKEELFDWLGNLHGEGGEPDPIDIKPFEGQTLQQIESRLRVLKHEELFVFDKDGKIIEAYKGDKKSVCFYSSVRDYEGATVTHGHPKSAKNFGGTFSFADMANMLQSKWAEHRATASGQGEMNYILRRTDKANPKRFYDQINRDYVRLNDSIGKAWDSSFQSAIAEGKNRKVAIHEARQQAVGVLNKYYKDTASKFGYEYITRKKEYEYNR